MNIYVKAFFDCFKPKNLLTEFKTRGFWYYLLTYVTMGVLANYELYWLAGIPLAILCGQQKMEGWTKGFDDGIAFEQRWNQEDDE